MAYVIAPIKIPMAVRLLGRCPDCNSLFSCRKVEEIAEDAFSITSKYKCSKCGYSNSWRSYPKYVTF